MAHFAGMIYSRLRHAAAHRTEKAISKGKSFANNGWNTLNYDFRWPSVFYSKIGSAMTVMSEMQMRPIPKWSSTRVWIRQRRISFGDLSGLHKVDQVAQRARDSYCRIFISLHSPLRKKWCVNARTPPLSVRVLRTQWDRDAIFPTHINALAAHSMQSQNYKRSKK